MDAHRLQLKIFVTPETAAAVEVDAFIPVFHRWIKEKVLPELLIDVANYAHVPEGPGVALIGHGSDYFADLGEARLGLLHSRKRSGPPAAERLSDLARRTLHVAALLEREPSLGGRVRFATDELLFRVNDRLLAPAGEETLAALRPELEAFGASLFGGDVTLTPVGGPRELFGVRLTGASPAPLSVLLERAGGPPGADASLVA
jgi:hypothetical protein